MSDRFRLDGEVAVVTGASGRLGPVWMEALLNAGARVAGVDLPGAASSHAASNVISDAVAELKDRYAGDKLHLYEADVCDRDSLTEANEQCLADLGDVSILVNNAGIDQPPGNVTSYRLEDIPAEAFSRVLEVNVVGAFKASQVFGGQMLKRGRGSIINIGSLYASVSPDASFYDHIDCEPPFLKPPAYAASKAALISLTQYFSTHWAASGIRVNALSPGGVLGEQDEEFKRKFCARVPMGRMAAHEDLKGPMVFLASQASSYITGVNLNIDGGFTVW